MKAYVSPSDDPVARILFGIDSICEEVNDDDAFVAEQPLFESFHERTCFNAARSASVKTAIVDAWQSPVAQKCHRATFDIGCEHVRDAADADEVSDFWGFCCGTRSFRDKPTSTAQPYGRAVSEPAPCQTPFFDCLCLRSCHLNSDNESDAFHVCHKLSKRRRASMVSKPSPDERYSGRGGANLQKTEDVSFREYARIIARDVPRVFAGIREVDTVRLRVLEVLRKYAQTDPEIGYTQGMCFAATVVCLLARSPGCAEDMFELLMSGLRGLWGADFPMVLEGTPVLVLLLTERDPELVEHLDSLSLNFSMVIPSAWLSTFGKWLPLENLLEVVPFLGREGLAGFLTVTLIVLLFNRSALLQCTDLGEALTYFYSLSKKPPPEELLKMCEVALPSLRKRING
eukprot:TRINITY_DN63192_c0_g1_i1.p1 TRINITY_DN63192_c0_g1~~TRINITY_DN63192_c0_g1_i1.p1  ORF type:complete len:401 (-),score=46.62 TRINITY_DN63192_c0_g1_i1:32-1234(-)